MEQKGNVYSCAHYFEPDYRLGSIEIVCFTALLDLPRQPQFVPDKRAKRQRRRTTLTA